MIYGVEGVRGLFQGNRAGSGGGLSANDQTVLTATFFLDNAASTGGGGFHHDFGGVRIRIVNSLFARNVHVLTIKPGFVDTDLRWPQWFAGCAGPRDLLSRLKWPRDRMLWSALWFARGASLRARGRRSSSTTAHRPRGTRRPWMRTTGT